MRLIPRSPAGWVVVAVVFVVAWQVLDALLADVYIDSRAAAPVAAVLAALIVRWWDRRGQKAADRRAAQSAGLTWDPERIAAGLGVPDRPPAASSPAAARQQERYESAVLAIRDVLPDGSPTPVLGFARFMSALVRLNDAQLEDVGRAFEARDSADWMDAFSALSSDALRVGFTVRWVRWPNPTDDAANYEFRAVMDPASSATESAAAALAEPLLTPNQRDVLYRPFAAVVPLDSLS
jgi:hypothetical protein